MSDLKHRELKMQEARKNTPRREFVKEICSWSALSFYKNNGHISKYPPTSRIQKIISPLDMVDKRDSLCTTKGGRKESETFLHNMQKLLSTVPFSAVIDAGGFNENTAYADTFNNAQNVYLSSIIIEGKNILYSFSCKHNVVNVFNSVAVWHNSENIYSSTGIFSSYNIFFSRYTVNCANCWCCENLVGCNECLFSCGLENMSYCIHNIQYTKEEYFVKKQEVLYNKKECMHHYTQSVTNGLLINATDSHGGFIHNSETIINGYVVSNVQKGRNIVFTGGENDQNMYDCFVAGSAVCSDFYAVANSGTNVSSLYSSFGVGHSSNIYYSFDLQHCSYCLGCVGLRNKSFCILNKQYSKEERYERSQKIFQKMSNDGELGKFFPPSMNPFYFNDTVAYLIDDSFTKEEVEAEGYLWRDEEIKVDIPKGVETVGTKNLSSYEGFDENGNWKINPEIMKKVIIDEKGNAYKIVKMEYDFLMKHGLPLPRLHWLDRIKLGFQFTGKASDEDRNG